MVKSIRKLCSEPHKRIKQRNFHNYNDVIYPFTFCTIRILSESSSVTHKINQQSLFLFGFKNVNVCEIIILSHSYISFGELLILTAIYTGKRIYNMPVKINKRKSIMTMTAYYVRPKCHFNSNNIISRPKQIYSSRLRQFGLNIF